MNSFAEQAQIPSGFGRLTPPERKVAFSHLTHALSLDPREDLIFLPADDLSTLIPSWYEWLKDQCMDCSLAEVVGERRGLWEVWMSSLLGRPDDSFLEVHLAMGAFLQGRGISPLQLVSFLMPRLTESLRRAALCSISPPWLPSIEEAISTAIPMGTGLLVDLLCARPDPPREVAAPPVVVVSPAIPARAPADAVLSALGIPDALIERLLEVFPNQPSATHE